MSREKMGADFPATEFMRKEFREKFPYQLVHQGLSAEKVAQKYEITRKQCDDFAFKSHHKAGVARNLGFFDRQIIPVQTKDKLIIEDEGIRYPPDHESLEKLNAIFQKNGVVTAGNASQITDGAAAVLLASADAVRKHNLRVHARILSRVCVGSDPVMMLDGVIPATQSAVQKAGLSVKDIDLFEINEAFASVVLAWQKTLNLDWNKVNVCGGACAHGHPLGATGAVLMTKLVHDLERTGGRYGLQTMCIGWGMATGTVIERTNKLLPPRVASEQSKL
jgi:acetyl-CoA acyltransferase